MRDPSAWREVFEGGSPEAENAAFEALSRDIMKIQETNRDKVGGAHAMRTLHAKLVLGVQNARLDLDRNLPQQYQAGHFRAGAELPTVVRLSNASGIPQADSRPDMRGMALRIATPNGAFHDLLMTNYPVSHARNAKQFVTFAVIASGERSFMRDRLIDAFGLAETERMLENIRQAARPCLSFARERFWSRGAILWGCAGPVRFNMRPAGHLRVSGSGFTGPEALKAELWERLKSEEVSYRMGLQRFISESETPIEDGATEWKESDSPSIDVATLVIPRQDLGTAEAMIQTNEVDQMAFNPWNAPAMFRPLGNLNRARKVVYGASARGWGGGTSAP